MKTALEIILHFLGDDAKCPTENFLTVHQLPDSSTTRIFVIFVIFVLFVLISVHFIFPFGH